MTPTRPPVTWQPDPARAADTPIGRFAALHGFGIDEYDALWRWSVSEPAEYWSSVWDFQGLKGTLGASGLTTGEDMSRSRFFEDARVNVAENLLASDADSLAILEGGASGVERRWTFGELRNEVEAIASWLRSQGIGEGDVVATVLPNRVEAVASFLAASAVGAVWTSCAPELSGDAILDRIGQVGPKVLFICEEYRYNGREFDFRPTLDRLVATMPMLELVVVVDRENDSDLVPTQGSDALFLRYGEVVKSTEPFEWRQFAFNNPGLVLYTSGTTGKPKAIVHSSGGVLLKLASEHAFHADISTGDVVFWYTNSAWMMFHWLAFALGRGAAIVLYEDAPVPTTPDGLDLGALWRIAEAGEVTVFGMSPSYMAILMEHGYSPRRQHDLTNLHTILAAGAPVSAEQFQWVSTDVNAEARFCPISGGTELMSALVAGTQLHAVRAGEMSCRTLGAAVSVFDDRGVGIRGQKGELVLTEPTPGMPLTFWGEDGDERYHAAYFDAFAGVWTHGDLVEQTVSGGFVIYGRSDSTLNPGGVRIGTAEVYRPLELVPDVVGALAFGRPTATGEEIVLCVELSPGAELDARLAGQIRSTIRTQASPRHVPHAIYQVSELPYTQNGKVIEKAAKSAALGMDVARFTSLRNPGCLSEFAALAERAAL